MRGMFFLLLYCLGLTLIHDDRKIEAFRPEFTNIKIFQPQWRKHSPCMESMFVDPVRYRPLFAFVRRFRGWASTLRQILFRSRLECLIDVPGIKIYPCLWHVSSRFCQQIELALQLSLPTECRT